MTQHQESSRRKRFFLLAVGDETRASSRLRIWAHRTWFSDHSQVEADFVVPHGVAGRSLLVRILKRYPGWIANFLAADVVIVQETLVLAPLVFLRGLIGRKVVVFDFSDPIDRHAHGLKGRLRKLGFSIMVRYSDHVMVENRRYLFDDMMHGQSTSSFYGPIDVTRLKAARPADKAAWGPVRIGWTGSPSTIHFLAPIFPALERMANKFNIELVLMGCTEMPYDFKDLKVTLIPWSEAGEFELLPTLDIGLFALEHTDEGARRGAGKLFLYLAAGVPFAASAWGISSDVMEESGVGFAVPSPDEWEAVLSEAVAAPETRTRFAEDGRAYAASSISYEVYRQRLLEIVGAQLQ